MAADRIAHYRVKRTIGAGGMATVYEAVDLRNQATIALKVLHPHLASNPTYVARFLAEAQMAKEMNSEHVVRVTEYGEDHGRRYLAMEYVRGKTLQQYLQEQGAMPVAHALAVIDQVAEGLEAANRAGIVHRDIKPQNIMILARTGIVKLMDFGIARGAAMQALTMTGMFVGTPQYSSPEQALGAAVDIRSDLYSVGVVLYQMLTGTVPFQADTPQALLMRVVQGDPVPVQRLRIDLIPPVVAVVDRLLSREPENRYQSPTELREALRPLLGSGKSAAAAIEMANVLGPMMGMTPSTPAPIPELRPSSGQSRSPLPYIGTGVLVVLMLVVALLWKPWQQSERGSQPPAAATEVAAITNAPAKVEPTAAPSATPTEIRTPNRSTATQRAAKETVVPSPSPEPTKLSAPSLTEPADGLAAAESVMLRWKALPGAASYRVQTRLEADPNADWKEWNAGAHTELRLVFAKDKNYFGTKTATYLWRVTPYDSALRPGSSSLIRRFVRRLATVAPSPTRRPSATPTVQILTLTPVPPTSEAGNNPPAAGPSPTKPLPPTIEVKESPPPVSQGAFDYEKSGLDGENFGAVFAAAAFIVLPLGLWQRARDGRPRRRE